MNIQITEAMTKEEAIKVIKDNWPDGRLQLKEALEVLIPELKESEDERIRKAIKLLVEMKVEDSIGLEPVYGASYKEMLAWLEKQGEPVKLSEDEQNRFAKGVLSGCATSFIKYLEAHTSEGKMCVSNGECEDIENAFHNAMWDRLHRYYCKYIEKQCEWKPNFCHHEVDLSDCSEEYRKAYYDGWNNCNQQHAQLEAERKPANTPKFNVGDWVVKTYQNGITVLNRIVGINLTYDDTYGYKLDDDSYFSGVFEKDYHLWTINDANDGDILEFSDHGRIVIGIVSYVNKVTGKVDVNCLLEGNNFKLGNYYALDTIKPHPATKEQCDILFQKMKEAGYEWDAGKKELKNIEPKPDYEGMLEKFKTAVENKTEEELIEQLGIEDEEQNPTDNVEPKFKVGDWCIDNEDDTIFQIVKVLHNTYTYRTNAGKTYSCTHYSLEDDARLCTIQDAKDGDVLADDYSIIIFRKIGNETWNDVVDYYVGWNYKSKSGINIQSGISHYGKIDNVDFKPATKEQCDLLFQKMKETGYEWDANNKELKKIEQEGDAELTDFESALFSSFSDAWQEYLRGEEVNVEKWAKAHSAELLEVAREQISGWREEDEKILGILINETEKNLFAIKQEERPDIMSGLSEIYIERLRWLKSLKERVGNFDDGYKVGFSAAKYNQWKPSNEQMRALKNMLTPNVYYYEILKSLYNDLKKTLNCI